MEVSSIVRQSRVKSKTVGGIRFELREDTFDGFTDWRIRVIDAESGSDVKPVRIGTDQKRTTVYWEKLVVEALAQLIMAKSGKVAVEKGDDMLKWQDYQPKVEALAQIITTETLARMKADRIFPDSEYDFTQDATATVHYGVKYARVDVGGAGRYMIDPYGNIFGIKAYGVVHRGHSYGTLDTVAQYDWGDYVARQKRG